MTSAELLEKARKSWNEGCREWGIKESFVDAKNYYEEAHEKLQEEIKKVIDEIDTDTIYSYADCIAKRIKKALKKKLEVE